MSAEQSCFLDTNILLYLLSDDEHKADVSESIIERGGTISVQVLNEFANVARKRLGMSWAEINDLSSEFCVLLSVVDLTVKTHERGCQIAEKYKLSVYDAFIVASALNADCDTLVTEDMQPDHTIEDSLTLVNPYQR